VQVKGVHVGALELEILIVQAVVFAVLMVVSMFVKDLQDRHHRHHLHLYRLLFQCKFIIDLISILTFIKGLIIEVFLKVKLIRKSQYWLSTIKLKYCTIFSIPVRPVDPCQPSPCGPGTTCDPSPFGNPICRCREGLIPKPDTITGCGPECTVDPECRNGLVCINQRCVEKPDPCVPSPCGPGAICTVNNLGNPICRYFVEIRYLFLIMLT